MGKRVVIVGAGIAGLSAGCYARMNGYDVEIYESEDTPGGLCTDWGRGEYTIDGCLEWLTSSRPDTYFYPVWEELGAVQGKEIVYFDIFMSTVDRDGRAVHFYTDIDRLEAHLIELSPEDTAAIRDMCRLMRKLGRFPESVGKAAELAGTWDNLRAALKMAPYLRTFAKAGELTRGELAARFKDTSIRMAVAGSPEEAADSAIGLLMVLGMVQDSGYVMGGSLEFARSVEKRLLDLGGTISYRSRVTEVLEGDGRAVGVRLEDGQQLAADHVISACDMRTTLFSMLGGRHVDPVHKKLLDTGRLFDPYVQVAFGVDMDFSNDIRCTGILYELEEPVEVAGRLRTHIPIRNQCHDPSTAPPGKSVVLSLLATDWSYWEPFASDRDAYRSEKERIAAFCREQIDLRYPGFGSRVEMTDVATPLTWARYTGNWKGTYMTWIPDAEFMRTQRFVPKGVPGLEGFYMASMWTNPPGGLPGAAEAGREVVQLLCHADGRTFETSKP